MTSDLIPSYPTGEYLEGNFVEDYINGFDKLDRYVVKRYGERALEVDGDTTLDEAVADWQLDVNSIVFAHLTDWAKMYSDLIKDYEPLWNVDGTTVYTYGETENTDQFGATQKTNQYGATQDTLQYGATQKTNQYGATEDTMQYGATSETTQYGATSETQGGGTDTHNHYERSYPDATNIKTQYDEEIIASRTNTTTQHSDTVSGTTHTDKASSLTHTDTESEIQHTDTKSSLTHTDTESELLHTDIHSAVEHVDTERRTGNIGVTETTQLIRNSAILHYTYNFYDMIFKFIIKEMGVIYYDWY